MKDVQTQIQSTLHEIATQAWSLANGLQLVAPVQASVKGSAKTIQYLLEISIQLEKISQKLDSYSDNYTMSVKKK